MQDPYVDHATATAQRAVTSYKARHLFKGSTTFPPRVDNVQDAIDLHCHAHSGQQDALALAKVASESGMLGIVFKTIGSRKSYQPAQDVARIEEELKRWADVATQRPIHCWAGYVVGTDAHGPSLDGLRAQLDAGVRAIWLPVNNHANSYFKIGARTRIVDPGSKEHGHTDPLPWSEALKYGLYMLDDAGRLKREYADVVRMAAEYDVALFFGHATHPEIEELAKLIDGLGFKKGVIDHPFSPFLELTVGMMRELSRSSITFNFTYDELSPLLGVDPYEMWKAIAAVGVEHCTLSSDGGEPLFPHSVECMRLIRGYMSAFGATDDELYEMSTLTPASIVGLDVSALRGFKVSV